MANDDGIKTLQSRIEALEQNFQNLAQVASHNAKGLDKLSRAVDLQTGTLERLIETSENQNELLTGAVNAINELKVVNQEMKSLIQSNRNLLPRKSSGKDK